MKEIGSTAPEHSHQSMPSMPAMPDAGETVALTLPKDRLEGLKENWRTDIVSGLIIFLIALPLSLAIAIASGMPPMAGIIAAAVGGMLVSQVSGSYVTINGPAAGLITVISAAVARLGGGEQGQHATLAAIVISGALLFLLGKLKAGELGDFFPLSVVHGMLASIGIIIMSKQVHIMIGVKPPSPEPFECIAQIPHSFTVMNPELAVIGLTSLFILIVHSLIKNKTVKKVPAPLVVVAIAIVLGQCFGLGHQHHYDFNGHDYVLDPSKCLVLLPANVFSAITLPNFSQLVTGAFLMSVVSIVFVQGLETLLSCAAVDKLDPWKRKSDLSKDVAGVGIGTFVSGSIGGLPNIAEIVRSTANVAAGARTRWSNFFHGTFLLGFVLLAAQLIDMIPTACLAAILVVTGFRLASPKAFRETYHVGPEQLILFVVTIVAVLKTDLLIGVFTGVIAKFILHMFAGVKPQQFFKCDCQITNDGDDYLVAIKNAAVFSNYLSLKSLLKSIPDRKNVKVDFSGATFVDHTVMERLSHLVHEYERRGGRFMITGLDALTAYSSHPLSARKLNRA
jgi:MFS superfamily sulfate permease-like transporter